MGTLTVSECRICGYPSDRPTAHVLRKNVKVCLYPCDEPGCDHPASTHHEATFGETEIAPTCWGQSICSVCASEHPHGQNIPDGQNIPTVRTSTGHNIPAYTHGGQNIHDVCCPHIDGATLDQLDDLLTELADMNPVLPSAKTLMDMQRTAAQLLLDVRRANA